MRQSNAGWITERDGVSKSGFYRLTLPANSTAPYCVAMKSAKTVVGSYVWHLIREEYVSDYKILYEQRTVNNRTIGFVCSGILLMMLIYSSGSYRSNQQREFLFNAFYIACMLGVVFLNNFFDKKAEFGAALFFGYFGLGLLVLGSLAYVQFTRDFLDTPKRYPKLDRLFVVYLISIALLFVLFTIVYFFTERYALQDRIENTIKIISILVGMVYIRTAFVQHDPLMNYLAWGNAMLIGCASLSLIANFFLPGTALWNNALFYYELGVVLEVTFFLLGLMYKNRRSLIETIQEQEAFKRDAEKRLYESKLELLNARQLERNRISADMHDDLGAGVTAIRLYSELAKSKANTNILPDLEKISQFANDLLSNLNSIIWTMNGNNDSLMGTVAYIRSYVTDYLDGSTIQVQFDIDPHLPDLAVRGEVRRNIFLVVKEAINNIVKHSGANHVHFRCWMEPNVGIHLWIHDNGKGINFQQLRPFSNGLSNMEKRMTDAHIKFSIESGDGTTIKLFRAYHPSDFATRQPLASTTPQ